MVSCAPRQALQPSSSLQKMPRLGEPWSKLLRRSKYPIVEVSGSKTIPVRGFGGTWTPFGLLIVGVSTIQAKGITSYVFGLPSWSL